MNKLILTDVDDTVLEYATPFQDWLASYKGITSTERLRDRYSVEKSFDVTRERAIELMTEYTPFMTDQPAEPCAAEVLPRLYRDGWRFVAITACGLSEEFRRQRLATLEKAFGFPWDAIHVVDLRTPKTTYLRRYTPSIWVEDNLDHAIDGSKLNHNSFLLNRAYNDAEVPKGVTRVRDWHEIAEHLRGL